jgi:hypothetical protein
MITTTPIPDTELSWAAADPRVRKWGQWRTLTDGEKADARTRIVLSMWQEAAALVAHLPGTPSIEGGKS